MLQHGTPLRNSLLAQDMQKYRITKGKVRGLALAAFRKPASQPASCQKQRVQRRKQRVNHDPRHESPIPCVLESLVKCCATSETFGVSWSLFPRSRSGGLANPPRPAGHLAEPSRSIPVAVVRCCPRDRRVSVCLRAR